MRRTHSVLVVAAIALFAFNCRAAHGQNCIMNPVYSFYVIATGSGGDITTYVEVYGYAQVLPPNCGAQYIHTGAAYNKISNTGGWLFGPPVCPSCYIMVQNNQNLSGTPGSTYPFNYEGKVTCSRVGVVYDNYGSQQLMLPSIKGPNTLWYFHGQNPLGYATSITLTANENVGWQVTSGSNRINLSTNSGTTTIVTPTGTHFSGALMDTCVMVTTSGFSSAPSCLTVRTPWELVPDLIDSSNPQDNGHGYSTAVAYYVHDNFGLALPETVFWNETVGTAANQNGSNWATCCGPIQSSNGDTGTGGVLEDFLSGPGFNNSPPPSPTPTYNCPPSGQTVYRIAPQSIYIGSDQSGVGTFVQSDVLTYWIDHGSHSSIVQPPRPPQ